MNLLEEIFDWARELPAWIQDAISRLAQKPDGLSEQDYKELYQGCLQNAESSEKVLRHFPAKQTINKYGQVLIKSLGHLKNVNRIDPEQVLRFAASGMTVVYGSNGTGKSGYSRVLKHACFSRDKREVILPDISCKELKGSIAEAEFIISTNGIEQQINWVDKTEPYEEDILRAISVFDSHIARISISENQECNFIPYGLDIVQNLGNIVIPKIKALLEEQIMAIDVSTARFDEFKGDDEVGVLFANLETADINRIKELATFTDKDMSRGKQLRAAIDQTNTKEAIAAIKSLVSRLKQVAIQFDRKANAFSYEKVEECRNAYNEVVALKRASLLAQEEFEKPGEYLCGTGGDAWRIMFVAAESFIQKEGCDGDACCALCQQPLTDDAKHKIERFREFIYSDTTTKLRNAEEALKQSMIEFERLDISDSFDDILFNELNVKAHNIAEGAKAFKEIIKKRYHNILDALQGKLDWNFVLGQVKSYGRELRSFAALELHKAHIMKLANDERTREKMIAEKRVLERRYRLSSRIKEVETWFANYNKKRCLQEINSRLSSALYTRKAKDLFERTVTKPLIEAIEKEFGLIGADRMWNHIEPTTKGEKGRAHYKLVLSNAKNIQIPQVLSEGEQKAVAFASFMAELDVSDSNNPIVLDDPVSSLDIIFKEAIAKRLVSEAKKRQVVIFSHDPLFICQLTEISQKREVICKTLHLETRNEKVGIPVDNLPWDIQSIESRIDTLEKSQKQLEKTQWPLVPNESQRVEMLHVYNELRSTIEQFVRDECLGGTVKRFDDYIRIKNLSGVLAVNKSIIRDINLLYSRCNTIVSGHDHSSYGKTTTPTVKDLSEDIEKLKSIRNALKENKKHLKGNFNCYEHPRV